jgi:two-component system, chemotaxis family, protein-glutamate methylesterase/glutaminase
LRRLRRRAVYDPTMLPSQHTEPSSFGAVVVVGSQGGLRASQELLAHLPVWLGVPVLLDLHRPAGGAHIEQLLGSRTELPVVPAAHGVRIEAGAVYLAPGGQQMLVADERSLAVHPAVRTGQPGHVSADPLLASAASVFGRRVIAVVLTGRLDGGAEGVRTVKRAGGRVLVQDPRTAAAPSMPNAALATGCVELALPVATIAHALSAFCCVGGAADLFRVRLNPLAMALSDATPAVVPRARVG